MHEYDISLFANNDGGLALAVHEPGSAGTSPYVLFASRMEFQTFFLSTGLNNSLIDELGRTASDLQPGYAFHERIFLPDDFEAQIKSIPSANGKAPPLA